MYLLYSIGYLCTLHKMKCARIAGTRLHTGRGYRSMTAKEMTSATNIDFHFDPACPLAWRTALWGREARKDRPLHVTWRFFSLEAINRNEDTHPDYKNHSSCPSLPT